jgi:hypothetical protein
MPRHKVSFILRFVSHSIGLKAVKLVLQAVQVGSNVRRSVRHEIGITDLRLDSVEEQKEEALPSRY